MKKSAENVKNTRGDGIDRYLGDIKSRIDSGIGSPVGYPYEKERLLLRAIRTGDGDTARRLLNEILGCIFFSCAYDTDSIKLRALELTVLMSRAALDGGADESLLSRMNRKYIFDFFRLESIDDICLSLTKMLGDFSGEVLGIFEAKHSAVISKVVSFIRGNYMHKITLEDTADAVSLSASHLSRIFKEEMHTSFNAFLSDIRIEKSKLLLLSGDFSIAEISGLVGFSDQSYFNKVFRKNTGMTPKRFREANGEKESVNVDFR